MMKAVALLPLDQQLKPIPGPHYPVVITPRRLHGARWEVKQGSFVWPGGRSLQPFTPRRSSPHRMWRCLPVSSTSVGLHQQSRELRGSCWDCDASRGDRERGAEGRLAGTPRRWAGGETPESASSSGCTSAGGCSSGMMHPGSSHYQGHRSLVPNPAPYGDKVISKPQPLARCFNDPNLEEETEFNCRF